MTNWDKTPHDSKWPKWTRWPNPFPVIKEVRQLACSPKPIVKIAMWGEFIGHWWFSNFVPSPLEIARKTTTGSYKCGFFLLSDLPSPLDLIWQDASASQALAEITAPITGTLYAMWVAQTLFSGLDMAHTLYLAMEKCDEDQFEGVLADGSASFSSNHDVGTTPFGTILWDPQGRAEPIDFDFTYPVGAMSADAFGVVSCGQGVISNVRAELIAGGVSYDRQDLGGCSAGGTVSYSLSMGATMANAGAVQIKLTIDQTGQGAFSTNAVTKRFIIHYHSMPPHHGNGGPIIPDPCRAGWSRLQAAMLPVLGAP